MSLRIAMVCPQFTPMVGGAELAAERLSAALAARGHQVTVISERRDRRWPRLERRSGFVIERVPCVHRRYLHRLSSQATLGWHLMRRLSALDIVHLHRPGAVSEVVLGLARLWRCPTVIKPTSTGPMGIGTGTAGWRGVLGRALERRVEACIALTSIAAREIRRFGVPAPRIHIVPNGIDTRRWSPADPRHRERIRSDRGISATDVVVLYVGRLAPEKNVRGLLEAWGRLATAGGQPRTRLVFVGDGPERASLEAAIDGGGWPGRVTLAGLVADPLPWYHAADVVALASEHEGMPNCLIEAMSCGLPVVAVRTAVPEEVLGGREAGELVPRWDPEVFEEALRRLIVDGAHRRRCGEAARRVACERYDLDVVAAQMETLYCSLLREASRGAGS